jgi:hypothetical protein
LLDVDQLSALFVIPHKSARLNDFLKPSALGAVAPDAGFQQTDSYPRDDTGLTIYGVGAGFNGSLTYFVPQFFERPTGATSAQGGW